jgi:hypothetical protein
MTTAITNNQSNAVISAEVGRYVKQFNQFSRKTAEAVIGMGSIVSKAKDGLSKGDFVNFCAEIRYDTDSSAIRKLIQIGKMSDVLKKHADKLPSTWTTIYQLTQLGSDVLEQMIDSGKVYAAMSGEAANKLIDVQKGKAISSKSTCSNLNKNQTVELDAANDDGYVLTVRFDRIPTKQQVKTLEMLIISAVNVTGDCSMVRSCTLDNFLIDDEDSALLAA